MKETKRARRKKGRVSKGSDDWARLPESIRIGGVSLALTIRDHPNRGVGRLERAGYSKRLNWGLGRPAKASGLLEQSLAVAARGLPQQ